MKVVFVVCTSDLLLLKDDQYCAYNIIGWDLKQTLAGKTMTPLRMLLLGEGGTGKSKVIQMVTEMFTQKALKFMHMKSTSTGIAASIIDGKMTHTIGCFSQKTSAVMSDKTKAKLQEFWRYIQDLVIDEVSMISKTFLALPVSECRHWSCRIQTRPSQSLVWHQHDFVRRLSPISTCSCTSI